MRTFVGSKSITHTLYSDAEFKSVLITKWPVRITCINFVLLSILFAGQQILVDWMNDDIDPTRWTITYKLR